MSNVDRRLLAGAWFVVALGVVANVHAQGASGQDDEDDDATDPWVNLPSGRAHRSCVHEIPSGAEVDEWNNVILDGVVVDTIPACKHGRQNVRPPASSYLTNGWMEASRWHSTPHFGYNFVTELDARWTVPAKPTTTSPEETVYFFPAIEDENQWGIVQPVLQWGDNGRTGGKWWQISSVYGPSSNGNFVYSSPKGVSPGDIIEAYAYGSNCLRTTGICYTWQITTKDTTNGKSTTNIVSGWQTAPMRWVFSGVLESYSVARCSDWPASGRTTFDNIYVYMYSDSYTWRQVPFNGDCAFNADPCWSAWYPGFSWPYTPPCNYNLYLYPSLTTMDY